LQNVHVTLNSPRLLGASAALLRRAQQNLVTPLQE